MLNETNVTVDSTDTERAWSAGLFDGEGCISVRKEPRMQLTIEIQMVHRPTLVRFSEAVGGSVVCGYEHRRGRRTQWRWRLTDKRAEEALRLLMPYMITKKNEALLAIMMRRTRDHGRRHKPTNIIAERAKIRQLLAASKAREFRP